MADFGEINQEKRRVAIYIRVSTSEQKIKGYGLDAQKKRLLDYVNNNQALNLVTQKGWIYEDVDSGSEFNRENLQKLLKDVKAKKFDAVLVWKIDRLSRSLKHLLNLFEIFEQHQVSFISVQENIDFKGPIGKLIFQIFGAIAQFERELIKGRTTIGKIASAELGNYTGTNIPYGYEKVPNPSGKGGKLEIIEEEKKWVQQMFDWYIYEDLGYGQIADRLTKLKVPKGKCSRAKNKLSKWTEKPIRNIICNPIYRGEYLANYKDDLGNELPSDQWTIVPIPQCVAELTFRQAQVVRKEKTANKTHTAYLLSGKVRDTTVDPPKAFVGCKRTKGGYSYRRKQFTRDGKYFKVFEVPAKPLEDYVWGKVMEALEDPEVFIKNYLSSEFSDPKRIEQLEHSLQNLRAQRLNKEMEIERVEQGYETGLYDEEKTQQKITKKKKELTQIDKQITEHEEQLNLLSSIDVEVKKLREASKQVKYRLEHLDRRQKKILVRLFVDRVELYRERIKGEKRRGKKWNVSADVYFKFNPTRLNEQIGEGSTGKAQQVGDNDEKSLQKSDVGRDGRTRTGDLVVPNDAR